MVKTALIVLFCLVTNVAFAEPVTLTVAQIRDLYVGLMSLDGYTKIIKQGEQETSVKVPYNFSGGTLLALTKDADIAKVVVDQFETTKNKLVVSLSNGAGKVFEGTPQYVEFSSEIEKLLKSTETLDLVKIKDSELGLSAPKNNPIPLSVLSQLSPIRVPD